MTKDEIRDALNDLDAPQPPEDATHEELASALTDARAAARDDKVEGDDDRKDAKLSEQSHPFYCPGCGRRWNFPTECRGMTEAAPHAPIEVVSTDELDGVDPGGGDPDKLTAAPATGT